MPERIYLVDESEQLTPMAETPYANEAVLQSLLENHPELLAGEQMRPGSPPRWLLVKREMGIADGEDAGDRWALDHLFLDERGIPTLIEVKRSTDTRIRRNVVGQMLDYAANAVVHWPVEKIRSEFERTCERSDQDPDEVLREFLRAADDDAETEADTDTFWDEVRTNLAAERIRIVFVADGIPSELVRIIEFLNGQMSPAEVFGVEVKHFEGSGLRTLVPSVVGQTAKALGKKGSRPSESRQWDEASVLGAIEQNHGAAAAGVARRLLEWAKASPLITDVFWSNAKKGIFRPYRELGESGKWFLPFRVNDNGKIYIPFKVVKTRKPFDDPVKRREWIDRLDAVPGMSVPPDYLTSGFPSCLLTDLANDDAVARFIEVAEWACEQVRHAWADD